MLYLNGDYEQVVNNTILWIEKKKNFIASKKQFTPERFGRPNVPIN
jgi:hypothetical protein